MINTVLDIQNIHAGYGKRPVLEDVSFTVKKGEFLGLIGPNGSGKTTLLRAVTKIIPLTKGVIRFNGSPIKDMSPKEMAKKIAVVSQVHNDAFFDMSVREMVSLGRIPHFGNYQFFITKKDESLINESMRLCDIPELGARSVRHLSGGERQRVFLARALAQEPEILLLDEPTMHLDITHQVGTLDLVRRLNKEFSLTVIMVLHDLNLAGEYCRHLALINKGQIHKIGRPEEVLSYQTIEEVYKTRVVIGKNPVSSKPYCFLVSEEEKQRRQSL